MMRWDSYGIFFKQLDFSAVERKYALPCVIHFYVYLVSCVVVVSHAHCLSFVVVSFLLVAFFRWSCSPFLPSRPRPRTGF